MEEAEEVEEEPLVATRGWLVANQEVQHFLFPTGEESSTEEEWTMPKGFILAIQTTLAIGAIMVMLEIMLTMASPLAVELEVDELEWTMQTKGFILAMQTIKAIGATMPILEIMLTMASP